MVMAWMLARLPGSSRSRNCKKVARPELLADRLKDQPDRSDPVVAVALVADSPSEPYLDLFGKACLDGCAF